MRAVPPVALQSLVNRFHDNKDHYKADRYNETQIRREFIDPFFELLGWDVQNRSDYAEAYKDVVHEDAIRISGTMKAPDYAFRIGGTRKFFLEAKKPSINIERDVSAAFQLRRYAWSAKLPLSILTDFEEFAVYDCRIQPKKNDRANVARLIYFTFDQYETKWDDIFGTFSRDAVLKGSFDRFADDKKRKRGTSEVDDAFLGEIEEWRSLLANSIAANNAGITVRQLNTSVQQIIDRIIFLRIAEDRGIEQYGALNSLQSLKDPYARLCKMFVQADERYNSGLFHFKKTDDVREHVDTITLKLKIDPDVIRRMVSAIYYPESPYEFSVLPADILGQVYEQFLGKIITLTGTSAKVEEKEDVKKAGGVYYTPTFIVRYLVAAVLSPLLAGKTANQVSGLGKDGVPIRLIDTACGSGSFLIEAYQYFLDWYLQWYTSHSTEKHSRGKDPKVFQITGGAWRLSISERRRILITHIYGVDLDSQAVEVTKLSLCLKVLEGETKDAIARQMDLFRTRALPDLHGNIKWGNSLVSLDVYDILPKTSLTTETQIIAVNPFDWLSEFPFLQSGNKFDAVVGNPPYLPIFEMQKDLLPYYGAVYSTYKKRFDAYGLFMEAIISRLTNQKSRIGLIVPSSLMNNEAFGALRQLIADRVVIEEINLLGGDVFKNVNKDTMTVSAVCGGSSTIKLTRYNASTRGFGPIKSTPVNLPQSAISAAGISVQSADESDVLAVIASNERCLPLSMVADTYQGIVTGADDVFISKAFVLPKSDQVLIKPFLFGSDIAQYVQPAGDYRLLYITKDVSLIGRDKLKKLLEPARSRLEQRRETLIGRLPWHALHWPRNKAIFETPKILVQGIRNLQLRKRIVAAYDTDNNFAGVNLSIIILKGSSPISLKCILAVLNSNVVNFWFSRSYVDHRIKNTQLDAIPIPVMGNDYTERMLKLEGKVDELLQALKAESIAEDNTATLWRAKAKAAREKVESSIEDLYGLSAAMKEVVRAADCNTG